MKLLLALLLLPCTLFAQALPSLPNADTRMCNHLATAIAKAEGFGKKGTIPTRYHNPGDIKAIANYRFAGQKSVGKGGHIVFRTDTDGWAALLRQCERMINGEGKYDPSMTILQIGKHYAGNSRLWAKNVSHNLSCTPSTTLAELFELPPVLHVQPDPKALEGIL